MPNLSVRTLDGQSTTVSEETITALGGALRGHVALPGSAGYEEARTIWNAMIDRRPALIARCRGTADYARLAKIKGKYDPTNLFRMNQNVKPA